jgi:hypothetical protein
MHQRARLGLETSRLNKNPNQTYPSFTIPNYQHKAVPKTSQVFTFFVQCPQTNAVLLKTVYQIPIFAKL